MTAPSPTCGLLSPADPERREARAAEHRHVPPWCMPAPCEPQFPFCPHLVRVLFACLQGCRTPTGSIPLRGVQKAGHWGGGGSRYLLQSAEQGAGPPKEGAVKVLLDQNRAERGVMSSGPGWSGCPWPSLDSLATSCYQARSAPVDLGSRGGGGHLGPWPWDWPERPPQDTASPQGGWRLVEMQRTPGVW